MEGTLSKSTRRLLFCGFSWIHLANAWFVKGNLYFHIGQCTNVWSDCERDRVDGSLDDCFFGICGCEIGAHPGLWFLLGNKSSRLVSDDRTDGKPNGRNFIVNVDDNIEVSINWNVKTLEFLTNDELANIINHFLNMRLKFDEWDKIDWGKLIPRQGSTNWGDFMFTSTYGNCDVTVSFIPRCDGCPGDESAYFAPIGQNPRCVGLKALGETCSTQNYLNDDPCGTSRRCLGRCCETDYDELCEQCAVNGGCLKCKPDAYAFQSDSSGRVRCAKKQEFGDTCASNNQCKSGNCLNGNCCDLNEKTKFCNSCDSSTGKCSSCNPFHIFPSCSACDLSLSYKESGSGICKARLPDKSICRDESETELRAAEPRSYYHKKCKSGFCHIKEGTKIAECSSKLHAGETCLDDNYCLFNSGCRNLTCAPSCVAKSDCPCGKIGRNCTQIVSSSQPEWLHYYSHMGQCAKYALNEMGARIVDPSYLARAFTCLVEGTSESTFTQARQAMSEIGNIAKNLSSVTSIYGISVSPYTNSRLISIQNEASSYLLSTKGAFVNWVPTYEQSWYRNIIYSEVLQTLRILSSVDQKIDLQISAVSAASSIGDILEVFSNDLFSTLRSEVDKFNAVKNAEIQNIERGESEELLRIRKGNNQIADLLFDFHGDRLEFEDDLKEYSSLVWSAAARQSIVDAINAAIGLGKAVVSVSKGFGPASKLISDLFDSEQDAQSKDFEQAKGHVQNAYDEINTQLSKVNSIEYGVQSIADGNFDDKIKGEVTELTEGAKQILQMLSSLKELLREVLEGATEHITGELTPDVQYEILKTNTKKIIDSVPHCLAAENGNRRVLFIGSAVNAILDAIYGKANPEEVLARIKGRCNKLRATVDSILIYARSNMASTLSIAELVKQKRLLQLTTSMYQEHKKLIIQKEENLEKRIQENDFEEVISTMKLLLSLAKQTTSSVLSSSISMGRNFCYALAYAAPARGRSISQCTALKSGYNLNSLSELVVGLQSVSSIADSILEGYDRVNTKTVLLVEVTKHFEGLSLMQYGSKKDFRFRLSPVDIPDLLCKENVEVLDLYFLFTGLKEGAVVDLFIQQLSPGFKHDDYELYAFGLEPILYHVNYKIVSTERDCPLGALQYHPGVCIQTLGAVDGERFARFPIYSDYSVTLQVSHPDYTGEVLRVDSVKLRSNLALQSRGICLSVSNNPPTAELASPTLEPTTPSSLVPTDSPDSSDLINATSTNSTSSSSVSSDGNVPLAAGLSSAFIFLGLMASLILFIYQRRQPKVQSTPLSDEGLEKPEVIIMGKQVGTSENGAEVPLDKNQTTITKT